MGTYLCLSLFLYSVLYFRTNKYRQAVFFGGLLHKGHLQIFLAVWGTAREGRDGQRGIGVQVKNLLWKSLSSGLVQSTDWLCKITELRKLMTALINTETCHHVKGEFKPDPCVAVLSVPYPASLHRWLRGLHSHQLFVYLGVSCSCHGNSLNLHPETYLVLTCSLSRQPLLQERNYTCCRNCRLDAWLFYRTRQTESTCPTF